MEDIDSNSTGKKSLQLKLVDKSGRITRRGFISAAATAAAFTVVPSNVLGGAGNQAPSDTLNVATVGIGGQGGQNTSAAQRAGANIVALCDVDDSFAAQVFQRYPDAKKYKDFRKMLDDAKEIEAVIVATPDHSHAVIAMAAMRRGKHVYVQKPMVKYVWEARQLTLAARQYKVITQMGNQGHSGIGVTEITKIINDGVIGDVIEVHSWTNRPVWPQGIDYQPQEIPVPEGLDWDLWIGPAAFRPYAQFQDYLKTRSGGMETYTPFNWRGWWAFGCGALGDMACHVMDPVFTALKLKYPTSVEACSTPANNQTFPFASIVRFEFPARGDMPPVKVNWYDGGLKPERPKEIDYDLRIGQGQSSTLFIGTKGVLRSGEYGDSPQLLPYELNQEYRRQNQPETGAALNTRAGRAGRGGGFGGGFGGFGGVSHEGNWVQCCISGEQANSHFDYSGPFTETVTMGCLALVPGLLDNKLLWDGENMKFTNEGSISTLANGYVKPEYREGWSLEM